MVGFLWIIFQEFFGTDLTCIMYQSHNLVIIGKSVIFHDQLLFKRRNDSFLYLRDRLVFEKEKAFSQNS